MIVKIENMNKKFGDLDIFENFNLYVRENEFVAIIGKSGSGKSTLLNIIGLLENKSSGEAEIFGNKNVKPFSRIASKLLRFKIGYLFQNFALLEDKSVEYNLMLGMENLKIRNKSEKISNALKEVGLEGYEKKMIYKCSGGEQQRIAIARLLLKPCELILADEPTGSLDEENKKIIYTLLKMLQEKGKTIIVVSHDLELIKLADRTISIDMIKNHLR